jgi:hypothetical protein
MKRFSSSGVRTAIISGGVAAMTALVITGSPAFAQRSAPAVGGTPIIVTGSSGAKTVFLGGHNNFVTLGKLRLATGGWTIIAKAEVSGETDQVHCRLAAGGNSDAVDPQIDGSTVFNQEVVLNVAHVFRSAGSVTFACNGSGASEALNNIKMTAIKAGTLTMVRL